METHGDNIHSNIHSFFDCLSSATSFSSLELLCDNSIGATETSPRPAQGRAAKQAGRMRDRSASLIFLSLGILGSALG